MISEESLSNPDRTKRALVVDDLPVNRRLLEGMLSRTGIEMIPAEDGIQAIELLKREEFDFVLMDVHMPGLDGLDTTRVIRTELEERKRSIPIIAISASTMDSDIVKCREAGMNDFLAKPFTYNELLSKIVWIFEETEVTTWNQNRQKPAPDSPSQEEIIHLEALEEMTAGNPGMMLEMLELFLIQTPEMLQQLRNHYQRGDWTALGKVAHTLKPTFSYFGIENAMPWLLHLEACKDQPPAPDSLPEIWTTIQALEAITGHAYGQVKERISDLQTE